VIAQATKEVKMADIQARLQIEQMKVAHTKEVKTLEAHIAALELRMKQDELELKTQAAQQAEETKRLQIETTADTAAAARASAEYIAKITVAKDAALQDVEHEHAETENEKERAHTAEQAEKIAPMPSRSRNLSLAQSRQRARNRKYPIIPDWLHDEYAREFEHRYNQDVKPDKIEEYKMYDSLPPSIRAIWREKGRVAAKEAYRQSRLGEYERAKAILHGDYASIRTKVKQQRNRMYANGGRIAKRAGTVINVIVPGGKSADATPHRLQCHRWSAPVSSHGTPATASRCGTRGRTRRATDRRQCRARCNGCAANVRHRRTRQSYEDAQGEGATAHVGLERRLLEFEKSGWPNGSHARRL